MRILAPIVLLAVLVVAASCTESNQPEAADEFTPRPSLTPATGVRIEELSREHVAPGQEHQPYNSAPATSGPHFGQPFGPVPWQIYEDPLIPEQYVHNLEHGGVGVFYHCPQGCDDLITQLSEIVTEYRNGRFKVFMSPMPADATGEGVYLAAWTYLLQLEEYDEPKIRDFIEAHESSLNSPEPNAF